MEITVTKESGYYVVVVKTINVVCEFADMSDVVLFISTIRNEY